MYCIGAGRGVVSSFILVVVGVVADDYVLGWARVSI